MAAVVALGFLSGCAPARAAVTPAQTCRQVGTDDTTRPIPPSLAAAVIAAFHVQMTPDEVTQNGVYRCADGAVLACLAGANLDCGKADAQRINPGAENWCAANPGADFVPAFAAGHSTIYAWRCRGTAPVIDHQVQMVDKRGFVAGNWRRVST